MPLVTGALTDFGLDTLFINNPLLIFRASATGLAGINLLSARKAVEVVPAYNGYFEADLVSTDEIAPAATHYTVEIRYRETNTGMRVSEVLPWKLLVPPEGGPLADLLRVPSNPALVWTGEAAPENTTPGTWWMNPATGDLSEHDGQGWTFKANLRGPAGYNATGAAEDDAAIAAFIAAGSGPTAVNTKLTDLFVDKSISVANVRAKEFGAKGDGIADDTAAIQAALNTTRDVYIPPGTYRIVGPVGFALTNTGNRRRRIFGAGDASLLRLDGGGEGGLLNATGAHVSHLAMDGGFVPAAAEANLLSMVQVNSDSTVENCSIYKSRGSCLVAVGTRIALLNNRLKDFGDHAIYSSGEIDAVAPFNVLATSARIVIAGNIIDDNPTYHNSPSAGTNRGAVKFRNNVADVVVHGNTITGDQCVLIDGDTRRAEAVPRRIIVSGNNLITTYSGVQVSTAINAAAGDTGIRVREVQVTANTISGAAGDTDNTGINLNRARASVVGNMFSTTAGISNFETGDTGPSTIVGNTFRGTTGIYKAGTGSLIEGNLFEGLTGGWAIQCTYHHTVRGNTFTGCNVALLLRTASHATNVLIVQGNTFINNTLAIDVGEFARSLALLDNTFTGNTNTATIISGGSFNSFTIANNRVLSGAALPAAGSGDAVTIVPVPVVYTLAALPAASQALRGRMVRIVGGVGVADQVYVCRKNAADAYEWAPAL